MAPDIRGSPIPPRSTTGIRRSRWTCAACVPRTRPTGTIPHDAEGVHLARRRTAAVAHPLRRRHLDPRAAAAGANLADAQQTIDGGCASGWIRWPRAWPCATSAPRRCSPRAAPPTSGSTSLLQLLPGGVGAAAVVLFFKLGIEQRLREVGLLRAVGFRAPGARCVPARGRRARARGRPAGHAGALGYAWLVDDRPAHVVGGRRRHDGPRGPRGAASLMTGLLGASSPPWSASGGRCAACRASPSGVCWRAIP